MGTKCIKVYNQLGMVPGMKKMLRKCQLWLFTEMVIVKEAERLKLSLGTRRQEDTEESVVQNIKRRNREKEA